MLRSSEPYGFSTMCGIVLAERLCSLKKRRFVDAPSAVVAKTLRSKNCRRLTASQNG